MAKKKKIKLSKVVGTESLTTIQPVESSVYGSINDKAL